MEGLRLTRLRRIQCNREFIFVGSVVFYAAFDVLMAWVFSKIQNISTRLDGITSPEAVLFTVRMLSLNDHLPSIWFADHTGVQLILTHRDTERQNVALKCFKIRPTY